MSLEQTNGKIHTYIYIYIYVYVSNQIQQNKMQPEHVSGSILRFVCVQYSRRSRPMQTLR